MTNAFDTNFAFGAMKNAFAPVTDALKNLNNVEVPEAARDFVKRAAGTAKDRAAEIHEGSAKVTAAIETAVADSIAETAKITRNFQQALYQDAEAVFAAIDKLASATSFNEAFQIQTELLRTQGEVVVARTRAATEYLGKFAAENAKTAQDNLAKVASYARSA